MKKDSLALFFKISSFQILAMFRRGLFYSYLSIYLKYFLGLSVTQTTLMATLPMFMNTFFQMLVWGRLSDKYQLRKTLIIIGEIIAALLTIIEWYLHYISKTKLAAGFVIIGAAAVIEIFWSMSNVGWSAMISDFYPENRRTEIQAKLTSLGGIGRIIGVFAGGFLYNGAGLYYDGWGFYKGALFFSAAFVMFISVIPIFFIPEGGIKNSVEKLNKNKENTNKESVNKIGCQNEERKNNYTNLFIIFLLSLVFINFGRNSIAQIKTQFLFLKGGFNVSSQTLSYIVNMQSIAMVISGIFIGRFLKKIKDDVILLSGIIIAIISLIGFALAKYLFEIYFYNFLAGVSEVIIISSSYTIVSILIPPEKRAKMFAYYNATFFLSWGLAGTFFAGPTVDLLIKNGFSQNFSYRISFIVASLLTLVGSLIFIYFRNMVKKSVNLR